MKRKLGLILTTFVAAICFTVGLSACNPSERQGVEEEHIHSYSEIWEHDETYHWHVATCGHDEKGDFAAHSFGDDNECDICHYTKVEISVHTHHYGEWQIIVPTEAEPGRAVKTCNDCNETTEGHTETVVLPVLGDERYFVTADTATCTEGGEVNYFITLDGETFSFIVETSAKGHGYESWGWDMDEHWRFVTCGHDEESVWEEHTFVNGVCEACGFKEPRVFVNEDNPESTIKLYEDMDGVSVARFWLPDLVDGAGFKFGNDKYFADIVQIGEDETYGTLWETDLLRFGGDGTGRPSMKLDTIYIIQFYCDWENGTMFKLYSVSRYIELTAPYLNASNVEFTVVLYQSFHETDFYPKYMLIGAGLFINGNIFTPTGYNFDVDDQWIIFQKNDINFLIEISYDKKTGWANAATVRRCYIGDIPSEDGDWFVRIIIYYDADGTLTAFEIGGFGYVEDGKTNFIVNAEIENIGDGMWIVTVTNGSYAGIYKILVSTNATNDDFNVTVTKQ